MTEFNHNLTKVKALTTPTKGFTLLELIVTISIVGVLLAIALPNLNVFLVAMRVDNEVSELQRLLLTARNTAINTGLNTIICPLDANNTCTDNWENDISVFSNNNAINNNIMDDNDILIKVKTAIKATDLLQYSSTTLLIYAPTGRLRNGITSNFSYCPHGHSEQANGITLSISGRPNVGIKNASGIYVNREGNTFTCT